jgi:hypothetical protein
VNRDSSTTRANARSTEPLQLINLLRGDLDWITLKALEKERESAQRPEILRVSRIDLGLSDVNDRKSR